MLLDGSIADMSAIVVGVLSAFVKPIKRLFGKERPLFVREDAIIDVLNGVTIVPFLLMVGSVFSSEFMEELIKSAKITLAIGGVVGLIFVVGELAKNK